MPKLSINGVRMSYEAVDCTDKLVIIKAPDYLIKTSPGNIAATSKLFKEKYNAAGVVAYSDNIDFETMDKDIAIYKINDYIDMLSKLKEELLEDEDDE